jgi:hypothetical protein
MITPSIKEIEIEERKEAIIERRWQSCCFTIHSESALFFAKLTISIMTISLCGFQLINEVDCSSRSLFSSILSSVVTYWLSGRK